MHGKATRIKIVLQGLHGNGVILPCLMVYGSSTIGQLESRLVTVWVGRRVEWSVGDSRIVRVGTRPKARGALLIFDVGLYVDLVFHEVSTRHVKVGQQRELNLRM
jgi:hypothetical protein